MKKILTALASVFVLASCSKDVTELPPETQTGANTFGAKVNGQFWIPQGFGSLPANDILEARMSGNTIIINARNFSDSPTETEFEIRLAGVNSTGTYLLNSTVIHPSSDVSYAYYVKRKLTPENEWLTSAANTGVVNITKLDTVNWIVSGTFHFDLMNIYNTPDPVAVTEGRFDLKVQ